MEKEGKLLYRRCCYGHSGFIILYCPHCGRKMDVKVTGENAYAECYSCGETMKLEQECESVSTAISHEEMVIPKLRVVK